MHIDEQGMPEGGFSKVKLPYPTPKYGKETYSQYRDRVKELCQQGFHLGDLSFDDWGIYCKGSGQYSGVDSNDLI